MKNGSNKTLNKNDTLINCLILAGVLVVVWKLVSSYFTKWNCNSNAVLTTSRTPPRVLSKVGRAARFVGPKSRRSDLRGGVRGLGPKSRRSDLLGLGPGSSEHKQACRQQAKACKQQQEACQQQQRSCERLR